MNNIRFMEIAPDQKHELRMDAQSHFGTFEVKDDATLWQKVNKLAHSTFDLSKFTIVGSPTITDDGIVSGFSNGNHLQIIQCKDLNGKSWTIKCKFYWQTITKATSLVNLSGTWTAQGNLGLNSNNDGNRLNFMAKFGDANESTGESLGIVIDSKFTYEGWYEVSINFNINTGVYTLKLYDKDNTLLASDTYTPTSTNKQIYAIATNSTNYIRLGYGNGWTGSQPIDLKQFSITVDGVEVFSGNRTGIDTIKPDNYTVVGSPTISADGVASGFGNNDTVATISVGQLSLANSFKIKEQFKLTDATQAVIFSSNKQYSPTNSEHSLALIVNSSKLLLFASSVGSTWDIANGTQGTTTLSLNVDYLVELEFTGTQYICYLTNLTTGVKTTEFTINSSTKIYNGNNYICLGSQGWNALNGSIDLNAFKIYVDGNLVYQPCLKIPYTEGQNYVKIVDKLYRDRVKDLFEQEGYNIYYTLGEDDFTLPSNKPDEIVKYKADGLTVAEQRADQTLTIRGACESGVDVNLPMNFFDGDSYAVFGVGTTGTNTASKFTPAADGNYIAIGKGKV